jgi:hypothetical protein
MHWQDAWRHITSNIHWPMAYHQHHRLTVVSPMVAEMDSWDLLPLFLLWVRKLVHSPVISNELVYTITSSTDNVEICISTLPWRSIGQYYHVWDMVGYSAQTDVPCLWHLQFRSILSCNQQMAALNASVVFFDKRMHFTYWYTPKNIQM